jgi:hypothetical protein
MHKSAQDDYFFNILWTADGKKNGRVKSEENMHA